MTCLACDLAALKPWHGFVEGCRGCAARAAARSPHFRRVRDAGMQDRAYRGLLEKFGLSHDEVKAAAASDMEQRT